MGEKIGAVLVMLELLSACIGFVAITAAIGSRLLLLQTRENASRMMLVGASVASGAILALMATFIAFGLMGVEVRISANPIVRAATGGPSASFG